jgi:hypothetical protein
MRAGTLRVEEVAVTASSSRDSKAEGEVIAFRFSLMKKY